MRESRPRLLVFIVAYQAEKKIEQVLTRIPAALAADYEVEILIIDDSSKDDTFDASRRVARGGTIPYPVRILYNPINQGYGGNQKLGYHYAIEKGFDFVALLHGDGQYAPECLPSLVRPLKEDAADAVFGSRMLVAGAAVKGGMPLYKFVGNKILTWLENRLLRTSLSEFHSGYRVYRVSALKAIPFHLNTPDFHFDTEIIIQLAAARMRIVELPIPTYYGDEICYVNGMKYAGQVVMAALTYRLQELSLFYTRKFDCAPSGASNIRYLPKFDFPSSHSIAFDAVRPGSSVVEFGCAAGYMGGRLKAEKQCRVTGIDVEPIAADGALDDFVKHDLDLGPPDINYESTDVVLLLDVIEHLRSPEQFVEQLAGKLRPSTTVIVTTGNVGFFVTRFMLLLGKFNYGKRGILDLTHTRLFTFSSLRNLFEQAGFAFVRVAGIPAPFPLALGDGLLGTLLLRINAALIALAKGLFSYQIYLELRCSPSLEFLLASAERGAAEKLDRRRAA